MQKNKSKIYNLSFEQAKMAMHKSSKIIVESCLGDKTLLWHRVGNTFMCLTEDIILSRKYNDAKFKIINLAEEYRLKNQELENLKNKTLALATTFKNCKNSCIA